MKMVLTIKTEQHIKEEKLLKLKEKNSIISELTHQVKDLISDIEKHNVKITEQANKISQLELWNAKLKTENKNLQEKFEKNNQIIFSDRDKLLEFEQKTSELYKKYQQQNSIIDKLKNGINKYNNSKVAVHSSTQTGSKRKRNMETQSEPFSSLSSESGISSMNSLVDLIGNSKTQESISSIRDLLESIQKADSSKINEVSTKLLSTSQPAKKKRLSNSTLNSESNAPIIATSSISSTSASTSKSSSDSKTSTSSKTSTPLSNISIISNKRKVYNNGSIYEGKWKNDKKHGYGKYINSKGSIYEGKWKDGKKDGNFIKTLSSGEKYKLIYENGNIIFEENNKRKVKPVNHYGEYASPSEIEKILSTDNKKRKLTSIDDKEYTSATPKKYKNNMKSVILFKGKNDNLTFKTFQSQIKAAEFLGGCENYISINKNSDKYIYGWKIYNDDELPLKYANAYNKFMESKKSNESSSSSISNDFDNSKKKI